MLGMTGYMREILGRRVYDSPELTCSQERRPINVFVSVRWGLRRWHGCP